MVCNSLFSLKLVSARLATAIEGTALSQGLGLLEHVSSMKNAEAPNINHKNFWSISNTKDTAEGSRENPLTYEPASSPEGKLKPPSVYSHDEDYVFLRMVYEISRAAEYYSKVFEENTTDKMLSDSKGKISSLDTTKAALHAIQKCYTACVDQKTGTSRLHVVYYLRGVLNFGGLCTAICSGDGETSHHLIHTLNSVALNMATKTIMMLVGTSGNNLKTTLRDIGKKSWL